MAKFRIELSAFAVVRQTQLVDADSQEEAETLALKDYDNHVWEYDGLDVNNNVEIDAIDQCPGD